MKHRLLVIEDDRELQSVLREVLLENDYAVDQAYKGVEGLEKAEAAQPDLIILDLGLPDLDGESVCRRLKKLFPDLPVIILTAKNTTDDLVHSLGLGADDYVAKPFDIDELLARLKARLRGNQTQKVLQVADLELNSEKIEVSRNGQPLKLTQKEFSLLEYLMRNPGRVLSRNMILNRVWSYNTDVETRVVDVYIGYLRRKIDRPFKKKLIHSVTGFGYVIRD